MTLARGCRLLLTKPVHTHRDTEEPISLASSLKEGGRSSGTTTGASGLLAVVCECQEEGWGLAKSGESSSISYMSPRQGIGSVPSPVKQGRRCCD